MPVSTGKRGTARESGGGEAAPVQPTVLCWGRSDRDYSRNRILRQAFAELGWSVHDYTPRFSALADLRAGWHIGIRPDLVWVPCFRQRDLPAAARWARRRGIPVLFDPLISAYDKRVFERGKLKPESRAAQRLLAREIRGFARADVVLADTDRHAEFFSQTLRVAQEKIHVLPVSAEEALFTPAAGAPGDPLEVLFYGSFIPLQGPDVIVEAARIYQGPPVRWTLLGDGPLLSACKAAARGLGNVRFEPWLDYERLPARIRDADILLGIFGTTPKALRVVPNKAYQALCCGRPLVTLSGPAYPSHLRATSNAGIRWVTPGNPQELADAVAELAARPEALATLGVAARHTYYAHFSYDRVVSGLRDALAALGLRSEWVSADAAQNSATPRNTT